MNERAGHLRKCELMAVVFCTAMIVLVLGAAALAGRERAKAAVCQANLRQWHRVFQGYIAENDGKFLTGTDSGYHWPLQLPHEYQDWKKNRAWFCPHGRDNHGKAKWTEKN